MMASLEIDCTNEWENIQEPPPSENSCSESQICPPKNNVEESEINSGIKRGSSLANIPNILSFGDGSSPIELETMPVSVIEKKYKKRTKTMRNRPYLANHGHVLAERKQRDVLNTLSSLVPGLKKRDEASVLSKAVEYVKQLQENLKTLKEQVASKNKAVEDEPTNKHAKLVSITGGQSPKIEIRVFGNSFLIKIHCFQAGMLTFVKALDLVRSLHMRVVSTNSVQVLEHTHLTIACQVQEGFEVRVNDLFKSLMSALENSVQPE